MRESVNIKKLRTHLRTRDERTLASQLKNCTDQELLDLSFNEKSDAVKLLARDPHPESEKQRARLIRITPPRDRMRLAGLLEAASPDRTAPHPMAWEPESEILEMSWDAPPAVEDDDVTDKSQKTAPQRRAPRLEGLDALISAIQSGPSRPQPGVVNLHGATGKKPPAASKRLALLDAAIEKLAGRPLVVVGVQGEFDDSVTSALSERYARRLVAAVAIGDTPPEPPLPNQVAALDPVEAGAKLARQGMIDRDGMRTIVSEARSAGFSADDVQLSLGRK